MVCWDVAYLPSYPIKLSEAIVDEGTMGPGRMTFQSKFEIANFQIKKGHFLRDGLIWFARQVPEFANNHRSVFHILVHDDDDYVFRKLC